MPEEQQLSTEQKDIGKDKLDKSRVRLINIDNSAFFATEIPDVIPPIEKLQYVKDDGSFTSEHIKNAEDPAFFWRNAKPLLGKIMFGSAAIIFIIILASTSKYQEGVWTFFASLISMGIKFVLGLFSSAPATP